MADRVLHDECAQPFGSAQRQAHANAPAVVLHRERVAGEADFVSELLNDLGEVVERVAEAQAVRRSGWPVPSGFPACSQARRSSRHHNCLTAIEQMDTYTRSGP